MERRKKSSARLIEPLAFLKPRVQRFAVRSLGYGPRFTEWHGEEVSPVLGTEDSLPGKE